MSDEVGYIDFLEFASHSEGKCHLVFDDELTFLEAGYGTSDFMEFLATGSKEVLDDAFRMSDVSIDQIKTSRNF